MNITVVQDFQDGTLKEVFEKLGYPAKWKAGEKRILPDAVVQQVVRSGGQITIADANAKESKVVIGATPSTIDTDKHYKELHKKSPRVTVVFVEGFRDGSLADELAALGHPADFGVGEIFALPKELLEKVIRSGCLVETNAEIIAQYRSIQGKHILKVEQWQARIAKDKEYELSQKQNQAHNEKLLAEVEVLSTRALNQTGKAKEATWQRIHELYSLMK